MCNLPPVIKYAKQVVKSLREQTIQELFKENLDLFLKNIPDQPMVVGLTPSPCNLTNNRSLTAPRSGEA